LSKPALTPQNLGGRVPPNLAGYLTQKL
jgi:hypothetical protein